MSNFAVELSALIDKWRGLGEELESIVDALQDQAEKWEDKLLVSLTTCKLKSNGERP